ncbi:protocadherin Fat 4-like [Pecten maximus]|uniref:protocadherin Fat 4-like n=1 Tax=Pecten maximus TaxID=6579 RepID=UPI0014587A19|nr:protocadherin Fat 4-like [Pecten maximus]
MTGKYSDFFHVDNHGDIYCAKTISFEDMNQAEDIYAFVTELDIGMTITIDETKMVTKLSLLVVRDTFSQTIPEDTPENITVGRFGSDTPYNLFDFNLTDTSIQSVFFRYFNFNSLSGTIQKSSFLLDFTNTNAREFEFEIRIRWKSTMDFIRVPGKLTINDVNNLAPKCVEPVSVFQVISGSPSRSYIGAVQASDVDTVGTVSYIIDDAEYSKVFDITRQTGVITAKQAMTASLLGDRVSFTVGASDGFKTVECHVVVEILKLSNENANLNLIFNGTLQEETPAPALVANVFVRNYTNFKFITTKDEENFALNSTTGEVTSKVKLDREKLPLVFRDNKVTFGIQANLDDEDSCTITIMGELTITVTDINDNPPCFVGDGNCTVTFQGSVMENVTGRQDVKLKDNRELKLFDPDETDNGGLTVTLDPNDGKLTTEVTNNVVNIFSDHIFDREETDHFSVTLRVSDTGGHTATASLVITIEDKNDNPPVFINQPYQYRISEDEAVGFHVGVVSASDRDTGQNAEILYSLYSSYFSVDERTGNITVKGTLNRESIPSFNDTLLAKDNGHPSLTATTSVFIQILDVNDNAPVFTQNEYRFITDENNDCNVSLGSVNATDQDIGNNSKIHFTISFSSRKFRVNKDGEIFCVGAGLDYEDSPNQNFVVTATDDGIPSRSSSTHVVIQVIDKNDNAPLFKNNVTVVNVTDTDFNPPKLVALLEVTDKDSGDNKRFRFTICPEYNKSFTVKDTGAVFTTSQKPSTWPRLECKVTVTDYGREPLSSFAFIEFYVVDNSGGGGQSGVVFNSSNFTLKVQEVYNRTEDIGSLWIQNNRTSNVTFALISSVDGGINNNNLTTDCASFYLDPLSGKVTKNGILDRETKDLYTFLASVQENMDKDLTLVTINVEDVNEPPEFVTKLKQFDVDEDVLGDIISKADSAIAVDRDLGENGTMVFSLKKQEPLQDGQFNFKVNDTNGDISVVLGLDYETVKQYNITMEVGDKGHPPSDPITRTFNVLVNDVNDNAPTFVNTSSKNGKCLYDIKVYENETADSIVLGFSINDEDGKTFFKTSELTVNNQDDCPLKPVTYGFPTMSLLSDGTLDYETQQAYDCVITVTNVAPPRLSNNCSVHVSVLDVNDNVPQTHGPYRVNVTNGKINDVVLIINATDKDSLENSRLVYQFDKETNETSFFKIDQNDGRITIIKDLFQFTCPVASFVVRVSDNGSPVLSNTTTVTLNIISNNTQPWFQGPDGTCSDTQRPYPKYSLAIEEVFGPVDGMTADKELLAITACDKDDGKFETCNCSYDIVNGGENYFDINKSTGMIRQIRPVNREKTPYFLLTISAVDHGKPPRTSRNNAFLNITVNDLDDNPPRFDKNSFTFNVSNNHPVGETFGPVRAKDPDFGKNSSATYSVEFTQESPFIYNETTGYFEISESLTNMTDQTFFMALKATGITTPTPAFTAIAYVEITVYFEDPNKSTPKFNKSIFVNTFPFSARKGYHIGTYTAVDTDKGRFGDITYHLESNYWDTFIVDSKKGNISLLYDVINAIPYYIRTMNLTLWATDGGEPPKSGSCVIHYTLAGLENKECSARIGSTPAQQTSDPYEIPLYAAIAVAGCLLLVLVIGFLVMFSRNREAFNKYQMTQKRLSTLDNAYELKNESYQRLSKTRSSGEYNRTYDSRLEERDTYQRGYDQLDDYDRAYDPEPDYDATGI